MQNAEKKVGDPLSNEAEEAQVGSRKIREAREARSAQQTAELIKNALSVTGRTQTGLAEALSLHKSQITLMLQGKRSLSLAEYDTVLSYFELPAGRRTSHVKVADTIYGSGHWREIASAEAETDDVTVDSSAYPSARFAFRVSTEAGLGEFRRGDLILCKAPTGDDPVVDEVRIVRLERPEGLYQLYVKRWCRQTEFDPRTKIHSPRWGWFVSDSLAPVGTNQLGMEVGVALGLIRKFPTR